MKGTKYPLRGLSLLTQLLPKTIVRTAGNIMKNNISESQIHTKGHADFVADKELVTEAGGSAKNTEGKELIYGRNGDVLAGCSASVVNEMVEILK